MADIFDLFKKIGSTDNSVKGKSEYIIAGLGNPGAEYAGTRHNAGFDAIDFLAGRYSANIKYAKHSALTDIAVIGGKPTLLMKPQTFMNLSGKSIAEAARFYGIPPEHVIVLTDDICQAPGKIRIRRSGSAGGHNGLRNIIECLGTDGFPRIRIGVGEKPFPEYDLIKWVLGRLPDADKKQMEARFGDIADAAAMIIEGRTDDAMGKFNGK